MRIAVSALRRAAERLFDHLEASGHELIELKHDYYWSIPKEQRYDAYERPDDLTVGQLSDNWNEVQRILAGEAEPLGYALVWLAAVLTAIGEVTID